MTDLKISIRSSSFVKKSKNKSKTKDKKRQSSKSKKAKSDEVGTRMCKRLSAKSISSYAFIIFLPHRKKILQLLQVKL